VNTLLPVVAKLPVLIVLPLTSGILTAKVVLSPLVKVKSLVPLLNDAVTKLKLVEVNKLAVAELILVIDVLTDALFVFKLSILIC
jgi:hypothetical protein